MKSLIKIYLGVVFFALTPAFAQDSSDSNPDPVFVFNRVCYAQIPNIDAIERMASELAWLTLNNDELASLKTVEQPDVLLGWDAQVGERLFRVAVNQSKPSKIMLRDFPDFEDGFLTSCSVVLDDIYPATQIVDNMQTLAGKEPNSANVSDGVFSNTTRAGGNET